MQLPFFFLAPTFLFSALSITSVAAVETHKNPTSNPSAYNHRLERRSLVRRNGKAHPVHVVVYPAPEAHDYHDARHAAVFFDFKGDGKNGVLIDVSGSTGSFAFTYKNPYTPPAEKNGDKVHNHVIGHLNPLKSLTENKLIDLARAQTSEQLAAYDKVHSDYNCHKCVGYFLEFLEKEGYLLPEGAAKHGIDKMIDGVLEARQV